MNALVFSLSENLKIIIPCYFDFFCSKKDKLNFFFCSKNGKLKIIEFYQVEQITMGLFGI
jgi:hypothetical protein